MYFYTVEYMHLFTIYMNIRVQLAIQYHHGAPTLSWTNFCRVRLHLTMYHNKGADPNEVLIYFLL